MGRSGADLASRSVPAPPCAPRWQGPGRSRSAAVSGGLRPIRRVVVALNDGGQPRVVADGPSPHVHTRPGLPPELGLTDLWSTDGTPADHGTADPAAGALSVAPRPAGTLFRVVQFPPDTALPVDDQGAPTLFWHETPTVDYNAVLAGELCLLTEHDEIHLAPLDVVVVRGGRHAWSNRTSSPAILGTVAVGLDPEPG